MFFIEVAFLNLKDLLLKKKNVQKKLKWRVTID